jgi:hypothetical protein
MNDSESSFLDLMTTFSKLDVSKTESGLETCPLCQAELLLDQFVEHVYFCIKNLDAVEDKKFAETLNRDMNGHDYDQGDVFHSFKPPTVCENGIHCTRRDAQHFQNLFHPEIACPICSKQFNMHEINTHLNSCLTTPPPPPPSLPVATATMMSTELSRDQLIAISTMIVQKSADNADDASDAPSILDMLETFGKLGFTKESLIHELYKD